jgi:hypothetical protein
VAKPAWVIGCHCWASCTQAGLAQTGLSDELLVTALGAEQEKVLRHVFGADDAYPEWTE